MKKLNILNETKEALTNANIPEEKRLAPMYVAAWIQDNAKRLEIIHAQAYKIIGPSFGITCSLPEIIFKDQNKDSFFSLLALCDAVRFAKDGSRGEYLLICFRFVF